MAWEFSKHENSEGMGIQLVSEFSGKSSGHCELLTAGRSLSCDVHARLHQQTQSQSC